MALSRLQTANPWAGRLVKLIVAAIVFIVLILVLMMFLEKSLIFFPSGPTEGNWRPTGFPWEDANFKAADGTELHGWYVPHPNPRAVVLFCHGNAGNITHRAELAEILHHRVGVSVLLFDYRGYGKSQGNPSEQGILADARAARAWLAKKAGVPEKDIVLMGRSLGGGVAVDLAADDGAKGLVLESTFTSLPDTAAHHYPWLPVRLLMRTRLDSASKIANYRGPLLQSHGDADTIVPYALGQRLFEKANQPKQFITLPGRDHNDPQDRAYYETLIRFLDGLKR
ncbi:MAG: alpha/beta hydrolase [Pirellulales bacterium]|nr:alpha/beta hydrolase [Pirellulales bacterium]